MRQLLKLGGKTGPALAALFAVSVVSSPSPAEELTGTFTLGWRFVDVDGAEGKYRQHVNLREGARVFGLGLEYRPDSELVDVARVRADSLGGEPAESFEISVRRFGSYRLEFGRRVTETFYEDVLLPADQVDPRLSNGGDFHHFDFERVRDFANLNVKLSPRTELDVSFDRFSRRGESTTVLDLSRDEFEMDQPIDESLDSISAALQVRWERATLLLQETYRSWENAREIFLPGRSEGENPGPAILDFYFLDEPTDSTAVQHSAVLNARPHEDVLLRFRTMWDETELDSRISERGGGTSFSGGPLEIDESGETELERSVGVFEVDGTWRLSDRVAVIGAVGRRDLTQDGRLDYAGGVSDTEWDLETTTVQLGLEVAATTDLLVSAGLIEESRDVAHGAGDDETTDHTGYWAEADWKPSDAVDLEARFEESSVDDPFTLASPTDRRRVELRARFQGSTGLFAQASATLQDVDNDRSSWHADTESISLRLGYRREGLQVSLGASRFEVEREIDQVVTTVGFGGGDTFLFPVAFLSDVDYLDANVRWQPLDRWRFSADVRVYESDGDFAVDRDDLRVSGEYGLTDHLVARLAVRTIEYRERRFGLNDYDADLVELGLGYRF